MRRFVQHRFKPTPLSISAARHAGENEQHVTHNSETLLNGTANQTRAFATTRLLGPRKRSHSEDVLSMGKTKSTQVIDTKIREGEEASMAISSVRKMYDDAVRRRLDHNVEEGARLVNGAGSETEARTSSKTASGESKASQFVERLDERVEELDADSVQLELPRVSPQADLETDQLSAQGVEVKKRKGRPPSTTKTPSPHLREMLRIDGSTPSTMTAAQKTKYDEFLEATRQHRERLGESTKRLATSRLASLSRDYFHEAVGQIAARKLLLAHLRSIPTVKEREDFMREVTENGRLVSFTNPTPTYGFSRNVSAQLILFVAPPSAECRAIDAISSAGRTAVIRHNLDPRLATENNRQNITRAFETSTTKFDVGLRMHKTTGRKKENLADKQPLTPGALAPGVVLSSVVDEALSFGRRLEELKSVGNAEELRLNEVEQQADGAVKPKKRGRGRPPASAKSTTPEAPPERVEPHMYGDIYGNGYMVKNEKAHAQEATMSTEEELAATEGLSPYSDERIEETVRGLYMCSRLRFTVDLNEEVGISKTGKSVNIAIAKSVLGSSNIRLMMSVFRRVAATQEDVRVMFRDAARTVQAIIDAVRRREEQKRDGEQNSTNEDASKSAADSEKQKRTESDLPPAAVLGTRIPFIEGIGYECRYHANLLHVDVFPRVFRIGADDRTAESRMRRWAPTSASARSYIFARSSISPRNINRTPFACAITLVVPVNMRISRPHLAEYFRIPANHHLLSSFLGAAGSLSSVSDTERAQNDYNTLTHLYGQHNQVGGPVKTDPSLATAHHRHQKMWRAYLIERDGLSRFTKQDVARMARDVVGLLDERHYSSPIFDSDKDEAAIDNALVKRSARGGDGGSGNRKDADCSSETAGSRCGVVSKDTFAFLHQQILQRVLDTAGSNFRTVYKLEEHRQFVKATLMSVNMRYFVEKSANNTATSKDGGGRGAAPLLGLVSGDVADGDLGGQLPSHLSSALANSENAFRPAVGALSIPLEIFSTPHYQALEQWAREALEEAGVSIIESSTRR